MLKGNLRRVEVPGRGRQESGREPREREQKVAAAVRGRSGWAGRSGNRPPSHAQKPRCAGGRDAGNPPCWKLLILKGPTIKQEG